MSKLKTISDKLDYIAMGKLNKEQMEYICEIDHEVNLKDREIERLKNIIEKIDEFISYKIIIESNAKGYQITLKDLTDIKKELLKLKGVDKE